MNTEKAKGDLEGSRCCNHRRGYSRWFCLSVFICVHLCPIAFLCTPSTAASISIHDDLGRTVELNQPAQRVVALAPFLTELVYSAGAGDRVAVSYTHLRAHETRHDLV